MGKHTQSGLDILDNILEASDFADIERRADAISAGIPKYIRDRVAFKSWLDLQEWRLDHPYESNDPIDLADFRTTPDKDLHDATA